MKAALTTFGLECRKHRIRAGMTLSYQASELGMSATEIAGLETTESAISLKYVHQFSSLLNLDLIDHQTLIKLSNKPKFPTTLPGLNEKQSRFLSRQLTNIRNFSPAQIRSLDAFLKRGLDGSKT